MTNRLADLATTHFENYISAQIGETVTYDSYGSSETFSSDGYLLDRGTPTSSQVTAVIATFTQKDFIEYDLGNVHVDDHKVYVPNSITPHERDLITRSDGEVYEVLAILHEHAFGGQVAFYVLKVRRRRT